MVTMRDEIVAKARRQELLREAEQHRLLRAAKPGARASILPRIRRLLRLVRLLSPRSRWRGATGDAQGDPAPSATAADLEHGRRIGDAFGRTR